jgi:NAD(P)-dependent dehydrogenase (short-subunit alcohol dehydrogenase family)
MDGCPLEAFVRRVIILGGLGQFGRTAASELKRLGVSAIIASRRGAADLKLDANDLSSIRSTLRKDDVVLDAAGPYYARSTALVDAAIELGFHIVDLNDDLKYAHSIAEFESDIVAAGICVLSSASSVSAISAAVVRHSGVTVPQRVTAFLAPASRHTANAGTALSLLRSVGRPVQVFRNGQMREAIGWSETKRFSFPWPVGRIAGRLFESADAFYLPRIWRSLNDVDMYVDTNTLGVNSLLQLAALSQPIRKALTRQVNLGTWLAKRLGSSAGGIGYEVQRPDGSAARMAIVGATTSFLTAIAPAVLAARAIALDHFPHRGLVLPDRHVDHAELFEYLSSNGLQVTTLD